MWATGHLKRSNRLAWQILFCLTVLSLLFRSAVPAGYMPGLSGPHGQTLTITLCTMDGVSSIQLDDLAGHSSPASDHDGTHQACPFCAVVSQAVAPGAAVLAIVPATPAHLVERVFSSWAPPAVAVPGPPLGSRAPPSSLI